MSIPTSQEQTSCISISGLTKAFGSLVAVNHLNLEVMRGDIFGFLGPNGSGKTTTIRMLLGLIKPDAGHIRIFGLEVAKHMDAIAPRLGAMIETPVFYPYLSGIDNLRAVAAASGMRLGQSNEKRIGDVLDLIDLRSRAKDIYRTYSLGMKQRLGIGAALLTDPELILLDEPTNGLDPAGVHEIRQFILHLAKIGKTVFISSHLLYEVQQVCNRVAILQKGTLIIQGNVRELLRQGERVVVRLGTQDETKQAYGILQQASMLGVAWIGRVCEGIDERNHPVLYINTLEQHYGEITALLAQQHLYITGMYPEEINLEEMISAVRAAAQRESRLHPMVAARLLREVQQRDRLPLGELTPREREVLEQIAHGRSNQEIAVVLNLAERTVKTHVSNILAKLHLADRTQAAIYALQQRLVRLQDAMKKESSL